MSLTLEPRSETEATSFLLALSIAVSERRKQLHLSQDEVGRRIGASRIYNRDIETAHRNRNNITMDSFYRIANALEWTPVGLLQETTTIEIELRE